MKTSLKKLTSVFLAVLMLLSVMAVSASAADTGVASTGSASFKFTDNQGWGSVYVYAWNDNGDVTAAWPGDPGHSPEVNGYGETFFTIDVPDGATGVVINNGNGAQTSDITDFSVEGYYTDGSKNDKGHFIAIPWPGGTDDPGNDDPGYDPGNYGGDSSTFKFTDNQGWGSVYVYAWNDGGDVTAAWPGDPGTAPEVNGFGETVFTITVPAGATGVVINNGNGAQTSDITDFSVEGYYTDGSKNDKGHFIAIPWPGDNPDPDNPYDDPTDAPYTGGGGGGSLSYRYVLSGYINGADVADYAAEFGSDGSLTYDFGEEGAYVFVRNWDTGVQYCVDGSDPGDVFANPGRLVNEHSVTQFFNKLRVDSGQHTLYLVENGDDTLSLYCDMNPGGGDDPTDPPEPYTEPETDPVIVTDPPTDPVIVTDPPTTPVTDPVTTAAPATQATPSPTLPIHTEGTTAAPVANGLNVTSMLNGAAVKTTNVTGKTVTVAYNLFAPEKIAGSQGVLTYDNSKLQLVAMDLPSITQNLETNNYYSANSARYDFTGIDSINGTGLYDFTTAKTFLTATFNVLDNTGTASINLVVEELYAYSTEYYSDAAVTAAGATAKAALENPVVVGDQPVTTAPPQPTNTPQPTTAPVQTTPQESIEASQKASQQASQDASVAFSQQVSQNLSQLNSIAASQQASEEASKAAANPTTPTATEKPEVTTAPATTEATKATQATTKATQATTAGVGKGADAKAADKAIKAARSDADPKGSNFGSLGAQVKTAKKTSLKVQWTNVSGAKKYVVYGNKCGKTGGKFNAYKKLKTTTGKSFTYKGLKKGTYYKFLVVAVDKNNKVVSTSKTIHAATAGGKKGNYTKVTTAAKKNKVSLKKGKTFKLKAKAVKGKLPVANHRGLKYESSNTKIAKVSSAGKITAKKKGTCYVYAYAQNGVCAKVKVTVK